MPGSCNSTSPRPPRPIRKGAVYGGDPRGLQERFDPDGFYSEAELLEHYREAYPPTPAADRRAGRIARLQDRQKRALETLERVLVQAPKLSDPPSAWLEPATARRLQGVSQLAAANDRQAIEA
jgi:hypothetical protein